MPKKLELKIKKNKKEIMPKKQELKIKKNRLKVKKNKYINNINNINYNIL